MDAATVEKAARELSDLVAKYCGGVMETALIR